MSSNLHGFGYSHKKGDEVFYKRKKTISIRNERNVSDYEWWYFDKNGHNLIRSIYLKIEGEPEIMEKLLK